jgi:hypothetical protein
MTARWAPPFGRTVPPVVTVLCTVSTNGRAILTGEP